MTPSGIKPATCRFVAWCYQICKIELYKDNGAIISYTSIPVTARSNAWVGGRLIAVITGSNPAEGMDVSVLCLLCVA
jgi:hypothetical protein